MFQKHQAPQVLEDIAALSAGKQAANLPLCHSKQQLLHVLSDIPLHTFFGHMLLLGYKISLRLFTFVWEALHPLHFFVLYG